MNYASFGWTGPGVLRDELCRPLERISAWFYHPAWRGASNVTLWRADGSGLRICSRMHEIEPRLEVGVLNFELVHSSDSDEQFVDLEGRFNREIKVSKLSITEAEVTLDSGIVLTCLDEIFIVPGGFPLTLALKGIEFDSPAREPEYPWDKYERSAL